MKLALLLLTYAAIVAAVYSESPGNRKILEYIGNSMGTDNIDPCKDFYDYTCGSFSSEENDVLSPKNLIEKEVNAELISYAKTAGESDYPEFAKKAYEYFNSCASVKDRSFLPYVHWMEQHENYKWALLTPCRDNDKESYDWVRTLAMMRKYGLNYVLISERVHTAEGDTSKQIIGFDKPTAGKYVGVVEWLLQNVMLSLERRGEGNEFQNIHGPLTKLENRLIELNDGHKANDEKLIAVKDLPFEWLKKYLEIILDQPSLDEDMQVTIKNMAYMEALDALLKTYDDQWICRFLETNFLVFLKNYPSFFDENNCMQTTRRQLPVAMHWIYEHHHPEVTQELPKINNMFDNIIKHINQTLYSEKSKNITELSKVILEKLHVKIGNLPRKDTIKVLNTFYENLKFTANDFHGNNLALLKFLFNVDHSRLLQTGDINIAEYFDIMEYLFESSNELETYYESTANVLIIPAELLRIPLYSPEYADVFKYSMLGNIMAYNVYMSLDWGSFTFEQINTIAAISSFRSTFGAFLSSSSEDMLKETFTIPKHDLEVSIKKWFFLGAGQLQCKYNNDPAQLVNFVFSHVPEFVELFDCKHEKVLEVFLR